MDFLIFVAVAAVIVFVLYKKVPKVKATVDGVLTKVKGGSDA